MKTCLTNGPRTPDMGGSASTTEAGQAISAWLAAEG
jgi:tartrate dehydrogenase/decarboxylase/D-malate dehydrogenase